MEIKWGIKSFCAGIPAVAINIGNQEKWINTNVPLLTGN